MAIPLGCLAIGRAFRTPPTTLPGLNGGPPVQFPGNSGVVLSRTEGSVRVRYSKDGSGEVHETYWAPSAIVEPIAEALLASVADRPPVDLKCPKCGKQCSSTSGLTLHLKGCKGAETGGLRCDICGKPCSSTSGLTLHKQYAHGQARAENGNGSGEGEEQPLVASGELPEEGETAVEDTEAPLAAQGALPEELD